MDYWYSSPDLFHKLCGKQSSTIRTLHQHRKGVSAVIKTIKLKKGEHISIYKDRLMIMKWGKKNCLISTTHDKMFPTRVQGQDIEKLRLVIDYHSRLGGVELGDSYLTSYHNTRKD